ncbi:TetR/AcrR family transcriptional regulator [Actinoplanes sp. CA-054009]
MVAQTGSELRERIVLAAAALLEAEGLEAVSTRAVASGAGVPPPTIFRVFGDKETLLEAVGEYGFARYLERKATLSLQDDPVAALRDAWDLHVEFGLAHPAYYTLVYGRVRFGYLPPAGRRAAEGLRQMITRVAAAGRLRMSVERAAEVMHGAGVGTILTLISEPSERRDRSAAEVAREMVIATITTGSAESPPSGTAASAMALRAALDDRTASLSEGERTLLLEWLNRLADEPPGRP